MKFTVNKASKPKNKKDKLLLEKIQVLRGLLSEIVADPDNSSIGSDTKYKPILDEGDALLVKDKLFELIKKL